MVRNFTGGVSVLSISELASRGISGAHIRTLPSNNAPGGTSGSFIKTLFRDSYNNMWIGNYSTGVDFASHLPQLMTRVSYLSENGGGSHLPVWCTSKSRDGHIWLGSSNEIAVADSLGNILRRVPVSVNNENISSYVRSIYADNDNGRIWVGTNEDGLFCYFPATGTWRKAEAPHSAIRSIRPIGDKIYISTDFGLSVLDPSGRFTTPCSAINSQLRDLIVNSVTADAAGRLWVAGFGKGISVFSPDSTLLASHLADTGFPSNRINAIITDRRGGVWAATERGLVRFDNNDVNGWHKVSSVDRLGISHINSLGEDNEGRIWFASNQHIVSINPATEEAAVYPGNSHTPLHSFTAGIAETSPDGTLSFPSVNGLIRVHTAGIAEPSVPARIRVTSFTAYPEGNVSGMPAKVIAVADKPVHLKHSDNNFSISFSLPDNARMVFAEFAYKLSGLDENWDEAMGDNTVTFHNVPPGTYRLLVKQRYNGDSWSAPQDIVTITIDPPIWLTWWAKLLYLVVALAAVAAVGLQIRHRVETRRLIQQEKEHFRNSQELNEERLRFYTNVTHELRTPLTLIMGPLEDIVSDPSLPTKFSYKLRMMRSNADQLLSLINGILEFRKTETLNRRLTVRPGYPSNLMREIGLRFKESTRNPKLRFTFDIEPDSPEMLYDSDMLTVILNNLLSNAVKYTPEGEIRLSFHTSADASGVRRSVMSVSDTGYGISGKALQHIFERYFQANGDHQTSGTGIGLALVKNLADLHKAQLDVKSEEGKGSTFSLVLLTDEKYPEALHFAPEEPKKLREEENTDTGSGRRKILVVEDNDDIREYIRMTLQDDADVETAVNGLDGLEKAHAILPDIIISDIMMPEMDGVAMCRELKGDVVTSHIPIVLLTAKDSITDKEEGYDAGADSYLTKPFSAKLLTNRIRNILMARKRLAEFLMKQTAASVARKDIESEPKPVTAGAAAEEAEVAGRLSALDAHFIEKLNEILKANIGDDTLNVALLADKMCMSNSTLYRKLMSLLGVSPNEYIRRMRMARATELLMARELSITEISFHTGFSSYNAFSKAFKKEFGLTPSEYQTKKLTSKTND